MWYHPTSVPPTHKTASLERGEQHVASVAYQNLLPSGIAIQSWAEWMKQTCAFWELPFKGCVFPGPFRFCLFSESLQGSSHLTSCTQVSCARDTAQQISEAGME